MAEASSGSKATPKTVRDWTVMVYMAAGDSVELDAVAVQDLKEMERGVNDNAHVVVQINRAWPTAPQRYEIGRPKSELRPFKAKPKDSNMGDRETLKRFLTWAAKTYRAKNYCLVLWGHAYGMGFGRDHNDGLTLRELRKALEHFQSVRTGRRKLELLTTNACAMSYIEAAYELRNGASYMAASQIAVPFAGLPYRTILSRIGRSMKPVDLGKLVVEAYVTHYNALLSGERVQMSLLNLANGEKLPEFLQDLTDAIRTEVSPEQQFSSDRLDHVRDIFTAAAVGEVRPLIDLQRLCQGFSGAHGKPLQSASQAMVRQVGKLFVHGRAHSDLADLKGIGIFVPFVTDDQDLKRLGLQDADAEEGAREKTSKTGKNTRSGRDEYGDLSIFGVSVPKGAPVKQRAPGWPQLVYDELQREIPGELMTSLTAIGATRRADRRDIAQIVLSIDASFNILDRVLEGARTYVRGKLDKATGKATSKRREGPKDDGKPPKIFGPPWLRLIRQPDLQARVTRLQQLHTLSTLASASPTSGRKRKGAAASKVPHAVMSSEIVGAARIVTEVVEFFQKVEKAVGEAEHATRSGMTNAKFGLGPTAPNQFNIREAIRLGDSGEQPKSDLGDSGEQPKSDLGDSGEQPKSDLGPSSRRSGTTSARGGDLRIDLAFERVAELFGQVGAALKGMEEATLEVEIVARNMLADAQTQNLSREELLLAARHEIDRAFTILQEASVNARRTVRRVLAHPVYGVGPTTGVVGLEDRQALASAGGLDRRNLRLL